MQIKIRYENEFKVFDLEKLDELTIKNIELFLERQKDDLFEALLAGHSDFTFDKVQEINDALEIIDAYRSIPPSQPVCKAGAVSEHIPTATADI